MHKSTYKINIILSTKILRNFRIVKSMAQKQSLTIECLKLAVHTICFYLPGFSCREFAFEDHLGFDNDLLIG